MSDFTLFWPPHGKCPPLLKLTQVRSSWDWCYHLSLMLLKPKPFCHFGSSFPLRRFSLSEGSLTEGSHFIMVRLFKSYFKSGQNRPNSSANLVRIGRIRPRSFVLLSWLWIFWSLFESNFEVFRDTKVKFLIGSIVWCALKSILVKISPLYLNQLLN